MVASIVNKTMNYTMVTLGNFRNTYDTGTTTMIQEQQLQTNQWVLTSVQVNLVLHIFFGQNCNGRKGKSTKINSKRVNV